MRRLAPALLFALLAPGSLPAQTREETFAFLSAEIRALASKDYYIREIALSPDGQVFTFRRSVRGKADKGLVIPLAQVDIYRIVHHEPKGYEWSDIKVRTRGQDGTLTFNGQPFKGTKTLLRLIYDERKARALDQAFQRLIELARGRKPAFPVP